VARNIENRKTKQKFAVWSCPRRRPASQSDCTCRSGKERDWKCWEGRRCQKSRLTRERYRQPMKQDCFSSESPQNLPRISLASTFSCPVPKAVCEAPDQSARNAVRQRTSYGNVPAIGRPHCQRCSDSHSLSVCGH
jgi:hypothetical protein